MEIRPNKGLMTALLVGAAIVPVAISACQIFLYPVVLVFMLALFRMPRSEVPRSPMIWGLLLYMVGCIVANVVGINPVRSFEKMHRFFVFVLVFAVPWVASYRSAPGRATVRAIVLSLIAGCAVLAVVDGFRVPMEMAEGVQMWDTGNMRDPQFYMVGLILLLSLRLSNQWPWSKKVFVVVLLLLAFGLLIHNKQGSWISTMASLTLLFILFGRLRAIAVMALCVVLVFGSLEGAHRFGWIPADMSPVQRVLDLSKEDDAGRGGRKALWTKVAPQLMEDYPWGVGYSGTTFGLFRQYSVDVQPGLNHLHNNGIQVRAEAGWIGLAGWLLWMGSAAVLILRLLWRRGAHHPWIKGVGVALLALWMNGFVEYNFGDTEILFLYALLLGCLNTLAADHRKADSPDAHDGSQTTPTDLPA